MCSCYQLDAGCRGAGIDPKARRGRARFGRLGARLKRRRLEKGLRQIDAAREMGVDQRSVINWEKRVGRSLWLSLTRQL